MKRQTQTFPMIAKTFLGLEKVLAEELETVGAENIQILNRAVAFDGDQSVLYKANYLCYTAIRILKPLAAFAVGSEEELYRNLYAMDWPQIMDVTQTLAVDAVVNSSSITHSHFAALKSKDAIADCFRDKYNKRPSVDIKHPDIRINIHIFKDQCTVALDSSGDSLHKRGYRKTVDKAPLNEVLAAGLIKLSRWDAKTDFIDPMCGSGTLPIEAAMQACGIPAGYYRKDFGFMHWKDFDAQLWQQIQDESLNRQKDFDRRIIGSDQSYKAVSIARENIRNAKFHKDIEIIHCPLKDLKVSVNPGMLIMNPPYGERLEEKDLVKLYKMIGDQLKGSFAGFTAWVLSGNMDALKFVGLHPSKKITLYNGPIECRFAKFEIYEGSKKASKKQQND